jgi:hypothetical protein
MATAMPDDPADLVLDAFEHHRVVAVGENHGHKEFHSWLLHLLERPDAQTAIDDIAIEWGNARYQDIIDRYVRGQDVPRDSVTMAWRNTVVSPNTVWDAQVYAGFFEGIRRINTTLEPGNQYRVLLADSPVDWDEVDSREDLSPYFDRAQYMAEVVRRESLLKGRHTLFIAGGLHVSRIPRRRIREDGVPIGEVTPVAWLELMHPGSVFVIQSMGRAHELGIPLLTTMGKPVARALTSSPALASIQANSTTTLKNRDGSKTDVYGAAVLSDIIDAVLLWDPSDVTLQDPDPDAFQIDWYWDELNRRSRIMRGAPMNAALRSDN